MHSYSSIYNLGHKMAANLFQGPVTIEEKVDGSQFSFGMYDGQLRLRSRGSELFMPHTNKLFLPACQYVETIKDYLVPGWTYRGETLHRPKHNSLAYERVPKNNCVIFDIDKAECDYLTYDEKVAEATRLGFETVPLLYQGTISSYEELKDFFERNSFLGGAKIEGMVIKNYNKFGPDKKTLMGKWVSEAFKEVHSAEWKKANPGKRDVIHNLIAMYKTEARWNKAIQHLKETGVLQNAPQDIGPLMKEINVDVLKECSEAIKEELFKQAWPQIARGLTGGFPDFYKNKLAQSQFAPVETKSEETTVS